MQTKDLIKLKKPDLRSPVIKEIENRFSPRYFSDEEVKKEDLNSILEAARWTPSAYNHQPWYFYWTRKGTESFKKILSTLPEFNLWSSGASVLIVACYIDKSDNGKNHFAKYDLGAAVMSLIIQAQSLGFYARQMGIFDKKKLQELLSMDKDHTPYIIIALGKLGDYSTIDKPLLERELQPRKRKEDVAKEI